MFSRLFKLVFLLTLTGCVSTPYDEPISNNVATIKFSNQGRGDAEIFIYKDAQFCTGKQNAGKVDRLSYKELTLLGGEKQSFTFGYGFDDYNGGKSCSITATFTPKINGVYEVLMVSSYKGCVAYLYEFNNGKKISIEGEQRDYSSPVASDDWCE
ncbi:MULTISPECIES: hypothetical protein [Aliivibrio]|mgnify:CR=1|uniref:Lipoprotein n=1 Tax=Aliivibrio finisterrensis TaxID=511998 RepID=A0A4Q5KPD7_9GAMM|nr:MULTISPECIES: hypothetical protein [Aliivibrio]MDD9180687.1 hypothetical protein [Aliivibrio sp. A6]RYU47443.1 hypothetical protein ERW57_18485 [Aliivibrio finisterrensis]RYU48316.1 hypothetical protein ERW56_18650 [Aliivibrio finisterrensis]RYU53169.1 hypothetical protein ERW50_18780 [Aliivibrio finisterrensis]RYU59732.1 hypothetical protein ERW53_19825 [Aliivibrio finisterrensis]